MHKLTIMTKKEQKFKILLSGRAISCTWMEDSQPAYPIACGSWAQKSAQVVWNASDELTAGQQHQQ